MEIIKANGTEYQCKTVTTGINSISFTMDGQDLASVETAFREVTELTVSGADGATYGTYENLSFTSATVFEDGTVGVTMHIKSDIEVRLDNLEASQEIQDEAIAEVAEIVSTGAEDIEAIKAVNETQDEAIVELADVVTGGE